MFVLTFVVLLAGCSSPPKSNPDEMQFSLPFSEWNFSDCFGFDLPIRYALDTAPGDAPPGWKFDVSKGRFATQITTSGLHCNRISMEGLERGPLSIVIEAHSKFTAPPACEVGAFDTMVVLSRILTNDLQLKARLIEAGMPADDARIEFETSNDTLVQHNWRWSIDNVSWSNVEFQNVAVSSSPFGPQVERFAWWNGSALSLLDITWNHETPDFPVTIARGAFAPDMLSSNSPRGVFAELADLNVRTTATAKLATYGDPTCEHPLL